MGMNLNDGNRKISDEFEVFDVCRHFEQMLPVLDSCKLHVELEACAEVQFLRLPDTEFYWEEHNREPWALGQFASRMLTDREWGEAPHGPHDLNYWRPMGSCVWIVDWEFMLAQELMPDRDWAIHVSTEHAAVVTLDEREGRRLIFDLLWGPSAIESPDCGWDDLLVRQMSDPIDVRKCIHDESDHRHFIDCHFSNVDPTEAYFL